MSGKLPGCVTSFRVKSCLWAPPPSQPSPSLLYFPLCYPPLPFRLLQVCALAVPAHWVRDVFTATTFVRMHLNTQSLQECQRSLAFFPSSVYLQGVAAQALYNLRREFGSRGSMERCCGREVLR
jgi:hypothetical protein